MLKVSYPVSIVTVFCVYVESKMIENTAVTALGLLGLFVCPLVWNIFLWGSRTSRPMPYSCEDRDDALLKKVTESDSEPGYSFFDTLVPRPMYLTLWRHYIM